MRTALDHSRFLAQRRFGSLEGLRCASIVAVIWHHAGFPIPRTLIDGRGFLGVDMFFVLSGFLIVTLLLRERDRAGRVSLRHFYIRRSFRIFPLYYGLIFAISAALLLFKPNADMARPWFNELPILLTYTSNWLHVTTLMTISWSLSAEEQFYLLWPPVERWLGKWLGWILGGAIVVSQLINFRILDGFLATLGAGEDDLPMLRQTTFTPILLGVAMAHVLHDPRGFRATARLLGARSTPLVVSAGLLLLLILAPEDLSGLPRLSVHVGMLLLLTSCVVREDHALARVLKWGPLVRLGVISYGMYLLHVIALHLATNALEVTGVSFMGARFLLCLALTVVLAELSFRLYETPFLRLKDRFGRAQSSPATSPSSSQASLALSPLARRERTAPPR